MVTRELVIGALRSALEGAPEARAAWLAGSDATGRADDLSDVDLFVIAAAGQTERAFEIVEQALARLSPIAIRDRLAQPTWHGMEQVFFQLKDAPEHLMVDVVGIEAGKPCQFLEVERHGTARALFDKDGLVRPAPVDRAALAERMAKRVEEVRRRFPLLKHVPVKFAKRGLAADAIYFYHGLVLRPLVDMLRITKCPDRFDFGFRYLRDDLPAADHALVERLMLMGDLGGLAERVREADARVQSALAEWDAGRRGA